MALKKKKNVRGGGHSSGDDSGDDHGGPSDEEEDEGDALLRDSTALKGGRGGVLEPGYLNIVRRVYVAGYGCPCVGREGNFFAARRAFCPWRLGMCWGEVLSGGFSTLLIAQK